MNYRLVRSAYIRLSEFLSNGIEGIRFSLATALVVALCGLGISILLLHIAGVTGLLMVRALMLFFLSFFVILIIKKLNLLSRRHVYDERAMQSLAGIYIALKPEIPLPYFRSTALSTDSCLEYIRLIRKSRPKLVLELGSGSSTVIAGYQVKQNGLGYVIALDHDEEWGGNQRPPART